MIKVNCVQCRKEVFKHKCHIKPHWKPFCSRQCYFVHKGTSFKPTVKKCLNCGKEFESGGRGRHQKQVRFCSRKCGFLSRRKRETRNCLNCNSEIIKPISHFKGEQTFCSKSCMNNFRKGKIKVLLNNNSYRNYRAKLISEIGKCQKCGFNKHPLILHVHHKDRNRKNNLPENLELICPNCHEFEHRFRPRLKH